MKKLLATTAVLALLAAPAMADNTDTATITVGGEVIAALEITEATATLAMPTVVTDTAAPTTVRVACGAANDAANTVTYTNNGNPYANGTAAAANPSATSTNLLTVLGNATGTCAELNLTGQASYNYAIALGAPTNANADGITVTATDCFVTSISGISTTGILTGGTDVLRCGATVSVAANTAAATYTGDTFDVTVTYD